MKIEKVISKEDFLAWLEKKDLNSIAGYSCLNRFCPVANYIKQHNKTKHVGVAGENIYIIDIKGKNYHLKATKWLNEFISILDKEETGYAQEVTASKCIEVMKRLSQ